MIAPTPAEVHEHAWAFGIQLNGTRFLLLEHTYLEHWPSRVGLADEITDWLLRVDAIVLGEPTLKRVAFIARLAAATISQSTGDVLGDAAMRQLVVEVATALLMVAPDRYQARAALVLAVTHALSAIDDPLPN